MTDVKDTNPKDALGSMRARLLGEHKRTPAQELEARLARFNRKQRRGMIARAKKAARAAKKAEKS